MRDSTHEYSLIVWRRECSDQNSFAITHLHKQLSSPPPTIPKQQKSKPTIRNESLIIKSSLYFAHFGLSRLIIPRPVADELRNLVSLRLEDNRLTSLPLSLFDITSLVELNLGYNQISLLPVEVGKLTNLEQLFLHENKLSRLPLQIGLLKKLKTLDITGNEITWLPGSIGKLENLYTLWADGNPAVKPYDFELSRSRNVTVSTPIPSLSYFAKQAVGKACLEDPHYYCAHPPLVPSSPQSSLSVSLSSLSVSLYKSFNQPQSDVLACVRTLLPHGFFSSCPKLPALIPRCTRCHQLIFNDPNDYYIETLQCILRHWVSLHHPVCGPTCI